MKKLTSVLLLLCMILSTLLISCGSNSGSTPSETSAIQNSAEAAESTEPAETEIPDDLPDTDWQGRDFRIAVSDQDIRYLPSIMIEESDGDVVNDAVYSANSIVEERFNINLAPVMYSETGMDSIKKAIVAGDDVCELVTAHDISIGNISLEGIFNDVNELPYLNYDKPWWPSYSVDSLTVNGHMYIFSNYISYWNLDSTRVMFINKALADNYNIGIPYDEVFDGTWTLDSYISKTKDIYSDLNGNGSRDEEDLYGWVTVPNMYAFQESFGITPIVENDDGILEFNINNEHTLTLLTKIHNLCYESNGGYVVVDTNASLPMFSNNQSLFYFSALSTAVDKLRFTEVDYGILPMPKFDENQENYISGSTDRPFAVPITVTDFEFVGMITEAMSAQGYKIVRPAYFEIALKQKFTYDDESARILDIVSNTIVLDFSYIYSNYDGFAWTLMKLLDINNHSTDFASYYAKNIDKQEKHLEKIQTAFDKMAD